MAQPSPAVLHRCQKNAFVIVPCPVHVAPVALRTSSSMGLPATVGVPADCGVVTGFGSTCTVGADAPFFSMS